MKELRQAETKSGGLCLVNFPIENKFHMCEMCSFVNCCGKASHYGDTTGARISQRLRSRKTNEKPRQTISLAEFSGDKRFDVEIPEIFLHLLNKPSVT